AIVQGRRKQSKLLSEQSPQLLLGKVLIGWRVLRRQDLHQGLLVVRTQGRIQRNVPTAEALFHLDDFALAHMQAVCKKFGIRDKTLPLEVTLLLIQVVEEFSLVLGRSDLHQTVIVQEITEDIGTDPPGGIGIKAHAL